jgi:AcrR family transcriptional regulator
MARRRGSGGFEVSRERILDAAIERIASDGIDGVRIARIAMDAGVSTALVHYHFATREALLAEALEHSFERAGDVRTADTGESPAVQRLRDMVEQCLPLPGDQEQDWVLWVELWLRAVRHPELRPTAAKLYARMHAWFADAIEAGGFDCDADRVADHAIALLDGFGLRALLGDPAMPVERAREEVWDALARELGVAPPVAHE